MAPPVRRIGVISDTHGLLREEALAALAGSDFIIHAGDIGDPQILDRLGKLAPVTAVRGNIDQASWASALPKTAVVEAGGRWIYVLHDIHELDLDPAAVGFSIVISGHSHRPSQEDRAGVIYLNPGSAGPRRFRLPIALARINLDATLPEVEIIELG